MNRPAEGDNRAKELDHQNHHLSDTGLRLTGFYAQHPPKIYNVRPNLTLILSRRVRRSTPCVILAPERHEQVRGGIRPHISI